MQRETTWESILTRASSLPCSTTGAIILASEHAFSGRDEPECKVKVDDLHVFFEDEKKMRLGIEAAGGNVPPAGTPSAPAVRR
jgi:hypothetical protein